MGLIETKGYAPLVRAVDAALKAAQVSLATGHKVGGGLALATVAGDVGAVRAALDAAQAVISTMGGYGMTHVIARPDPAVWEMLRKDGLKVPGAETPKTGGGPAKPADPPALKPEAEVPMVRAAPEVPAVKPASGVPVLRPETPAPATKAPAKVPAMRKDDPAGGAQKSGSAEKKPAGGKKPRKPGKK